MKRRSLTRSPQGIASLVTACVLAGVCAGSASGLPRVPQQQPPAPIERRAPAPRPAGPNGELNNANHRGPRGEHLAEWMNQHSNLSPSQQQQALEREPGFHDLPQPTQQRMLNRLAQLDAMTPDQRQRLLARNEAMERLSPDQRAEVRGALSQLGGLPQDQRHQVAHTFRELRDLPPEQRVGAYATGRYGQLNDSQRTVLFNLLRVEPMLPAPTPATSTQPTR